MGLGFIIRQFGHMSSVSDVCGRNVTVIHWRV